ncbi:MAG: UDP-N-acetylmuramoyl-L-alanine--D-glutamate ligase [Ruminococcaceae bacterium]|nr:UDP-N-acetylmuramoyl-L-alanine--D-glutamate ligase [Oscillospiraceae bacterium]
MDITAFYKNIKGKTVAFCGIGGSNLPLVKIFAQKGALVTARDRRDREALGKTADELERMGVRLQLGEDYLKNLEEEIIFRTPGMRYTLPELEQARRRGSAVTSEMELFFDLCPCKIVAVTGSDGKTTTTTIISEMLKASGKTVHLGGNIGNPLLPEVEKIQPDDIAVVELSSFQLISMRRSPDVAVVTNVSPNHLDVHKDMQEYIDAKKNILLHQNAFGRAVLNCDNAITLGFAEEARGDVLMFSRKQRCARGAWLSEDGEIVFTSNGVDTPVMNVSEIKIPGGHNIENYMAAICALWGWVEPETMAKIAAEFSGVEHRSEFVRELDGVRYYNDSIGTTPSRTARGMLSLFDQKIILIAGGYDKKIPFDSFGPVVVDRVKVLVLMGATADKIEASVKAAPQYREGSPEIIRVHSLEEAVNACRKAAVEGDIVALSPACASFDMFPNYETRGEEFKKLVNLL